jgi:hypothetical protein
MRHDKERLSAEWIVEEYPSLPLDLGRELIAFALESWAEVGAYVEEDRAKLEATRGGPSPRAYCARTAAAVERKRA